MAATAGKKRKREPSAAEAVAFAQKVARNPIVATDQFSASKGKVLEIQQESMPAEGPGTKKRRTLGDDGKAYPADRRLCSPLLFQEEKRRKQPFVLATPAPSYKDHTARIASDHARIRNDAEKELQIIHYHIKEDRLIPLVQPKGDSQAYSSSAPSEGASSGGSYLIGAGRLALTSPGTRGQSGTGTGVEPLPGASSSAALLSPGVQASAASSSSSSAASASGGNGSAEGGKGTSSGRLDRFDPRVSSKEAKRRARHGLTLAQDLRADALEQRSKALQGEVIELPRAKELSRLDSYLDFVSRTYYTTPEAGDAADAFSAVRKSTLGRLKSQMRTPDVLDKWSPYEVAVFEGSMCVMGKQPHVVAQVIGTKTTQEVMEFYYLWKKSKNYAKWKQTFKPPGQPAEAE